MKRKVFASIVAFLLMLSFRSGAEMKGYQVNGKIEGLHEGQKVVAILLLPGAFNLERRDSAYVKNGEFKLKGIVPEGPREYWILFDGQFRMHLFINNGDSVFVKSNMNLSDFHHAYIDAYVTVYGASYNASFRNMIASWFFYDRTIINLKKQAQKIVDSLGFDGPRLNGIYEAVDVVNKSLVMELFTRNPNQTDSEIVFAYPLIANPVYQRSGHAAFIADAYNELHPEMKESFVGKEMKELTRLCIGQPFPDFKLPTAEGQQLALKEVVAKSKITIVHFWAVNSSNRRKMEDELRLLYKKYHDKGLNVIGFSSDKYADEWKDNVQTEQFPWYNVSDLKGKDGMVEHVYHEFGNPRVHNTTNVLIDKQGKILAWDVEGAELQWYLWKSFGE